MIGIKIWAWAKKVFKKLYHFFILDETELHIAIRKHQTKRALALIQNGANIATRDMEGWTPLHVAYFYGEHQVVADLIARGANVNARTKTGMTPVHHAVMSGDITTFHAFIERGGHLNLRDYKGRIPLTLAIEYRKADVLAEVLRLNPCYINALDGDKYYPLEQAIMTNDPACVRLLLEAGADVHYQSQHFQLGSALNHALTNLSSAVTKQGGFFLFEPPSPNYISNYKEIIRLLVEYGANVTQCTGSGLTPLHLAAMMDDEEINSLLIDNSANVQALDKRHRTPLHYAAEQGNSKTVALLLKRGAGFIDIDNNGDEPLSLAFRNNHNVTIAAFMAHGVLPKYFEKFVVFDNIKKSVLYPARMLYAARLGSAFQHVESFGYSQWFPKDIVRLIGQYLFHHDEMIFLSEDVAEFNAIPFQDANGSEITTNKIVNAFISQNASDNLLSQQMKDASAIVGNIKTCGHGM